MQYLISGHIEPFSGVASACDEGLLAVGGDLTTARLVLAYQSGVFPWYSEGEPLLWWSPNPRCVLQPSNFHASKTLKKNMRSSNWQLRYDTAFNLVIQACGDSRRDEEGTWITNDMQQSYSRLHDEGYGHSVEVWEGEELIGGLYGLALGRVFFGESMFSTKANASKIALAGLCLNMRQRDFDLIDCQVESPHLMTLGAELLPRDVFIARLSNCTSMDDVDINRWQNWPAQRVKDVFS